MSRAGKIVLLTSLYFSQGLPFGLFTQALPALLRMRGASLSTVSLSGLLSVPWALKFLWAPLLDRPGARGAGRRRVLLVLQFISALGAAGLAFTSIDTGANLTPVLVGVAFANLCAATQDVATDALAVDLLAHDERGLGNGVQVAGYRLGMIVGGGALLASLEYLGWSTTLCVVCGLLLLATLPLLLSGASPQPAAPPPALPYRAAPPEVATSAEGEGGARAEEPGLMGFFRRPGVWPWLLLVALFKAPEWWGSTMLRPFLIDRGFGLADIGWALGTVGAGTSLVGALAGGLLVNRLGRRESLIIFGLAQSACLGAFALASFGGASGRVLVALCGLEHAASGMATAALFTAMMDACRPESAATDYTVQACANVGATGAVAALSGFVAERAGYTVHFAIAAFFGVLATAYAGLLRPHRTWAHWPNRRETKGAT